MKRWTVSVLIAAALLPVAQAGMPEQQVLASVSGRLVGPAIERWAGSSQALEQQMRAFCAQPGAAGLETVRAAWRTAALDWQWLDPVLLGPLVERRTQREVNAWPPRQALIEQALTGTDEPTLEWAGRLGVAARGFPALEWLLFPQRRLPPSSFRGRRCALMQLQATLIAREAAGVQEQWPAFAASWGQETAGQTEATGEAVAVADFVNLLIAGIDGLRVRKLEKALERFQSTGTARDRLEGWPSQMSLNFLHNNLAMLHLLANGRDGAPGLGHLLRERGQGALATRLDELLQTARQRLKAVPGPLDRAIARQPQSVKKALAAVAAVQNLLEQDIASALGVDLSFNANDGD